MQVHSHCGIPGSPLCRRREALLCTLHELLQIDSCLLRLRLASFLGERAELSLPDFVTGRKLSVVCQVTGLVFRVQIQMTSPSLRVQSLRSATTGEIVGKFEHRSNGRL